MPKSRKVSNKIEIPINNHLIVRTQKEFTLNAAELKLLENALENAIKRNQHAIKQLKEFLQYLNSHNTNDALPHHKPEKVKKMFFMLERHFKIKRDTRVSKLTHYINRILERLIKINAGLTNHQEPLYINNVSRAQSTKKFGYVNTDIRNSIYLNFQLLKNNEPIDFISQVLLHEASHLYANTTDHVYYSETANILSYSIFSNHAERNATYAEPNNDIAYYKRMNNADSVAYFVMELTNPLNQLFPPESAITAFTNQSTYMHRLFKQTPSLRTTMTIGAAVALHVATIGYMI